MAAGSRLGRTGAGLRSRFASGPSQTLRLAGPIDSLVRVSRRVGRARHNRPRTRGADAADTGPRGNRRPGRHRERSRRAGLLTGGAGRPGPEKGGGRPRGGARTPGRRGPSSLPRSGRRRDHGRAIGSPTGPPVEGPAWPEEPRPAGLCRRHGPDRSRAPRPGEVHAARRAGAAGPGPARRRVPDRGRRRAGRAESPGPDLRGPPVYFSAASRALELSLQSAFQLSLTVLVFYRSRAGL